MKETDNYYVALDEHKKVTTLVLAEGNYAALMANPLAQYKDTVFVHIEHNKPATEPNQSAQWVGWSQKEDGTVSYDWQVETYTPQQCVDMWIRGPRHFCLAVCDWTQTLDAPLTAEQKTAWASYRQALRDMTTVYADVTDPSTIVWPVAPNAPVTVASDEPA